MFQNLKARVGLIVLLALASGFFLWRNYNARDETGKPTHNIVTLGLDLQGGSHFALELDEARTKLSPEQRSDAIDRALKVVRMRVDELGVAEPVVQKVGDHRIVVELAGMKEENRAKEVLQKAAFLEFQLVRNADAELMPVLPRIEQAILAAYPNEAKGAAPAAAGQQPGPAGGLLKSAPGDSAAGDSARGDSAAAAAAPGTPPTQTAAAQPFATKVQPAGAGGGQFLVKEEDVAAVQRYLALPAVQRLVPRGGALVWGLPDDQDTPGYRALWYLDADHIMTGEFLTDAQTQPDQFGRPAVAFELTRSAGRRFEKATGANVGRQMAIVIDERVYTAPVIQSAIRSNGQIEMGGGTLEDAADLALVLRAGALPAPLKIVEQRTVGASLGEDSVNKGKIAGAIGVGLVILLMVLYYKLSGVFAVIALSLYVLYVLGSLAALDAVLTFPGIAGLVLSIGMAVDANVLIFERIREELAAGRSLRPAISEGFKNALSAIVDSNLTTLITAAILFYVGTGPIRGFAVTLGLGIIASMFTAIFVTRTIFLIYLERRSPAAQGLSI